MIVMKRLIICIVILLISTNAYLLPPPDLPHFPYYEGAIVTENVNGLIVHRWRRNNEKVSGRIDLDCPFNVANSRALRGERLLFVNGLRHGVWRIGRCDSAVQQEVNYNHGLITGRYKVFIQRGRTENGRWINTHKDILYETYFENGNGKWKNFGTYWENGEMRFAVTETGYFKNGKRSGEWRFYTARGSFMFRRAYYENGIRIESESFEIPEEFLEIIG